MPNQLAAGAVAGGALTFVLTDDFAWTAARSTWLALCHAASLSTARTTAERLLVATVAKLHAA